MRPRLLPGLLEAMQFNRNHGQDALRFFEFGHVYRRARSDDAPTVPGFHEHEALIVALSGPHVPVGWDTEPRDVDIFDLKGLVADLLADLDLADASMTPRQPPEPSNGQVPLTIHRLDVARGDTPLGTVAQVHPDVAEAHDLDTPVLVAELDWGAVVENAAPRMKSSVEPVSRFPVVERDLAVLVHKDQPVGPMLDAIREAGAPLLTQAAVFDIYEGEGIDDDAKSVAFTLRFGADRTLTDDEVDARISAITDALRETASATLRTQD